jgi:cytochrome c oxidase subunit 1
MFYLWSCFRIIFWVLFLFEKMFNRSYNKTLALIHFLTLFLGVNLTFFPMHFLGLAGMPRRIPDFPDTFLFFNYISSIGSTISTVSVVIFLYILCSSFFKINPKAN